MPENNSLKYFLSCESITSKLVCAWIINVKIFTFNIQLLKIPGMYDTLRELQF